MIRASLAPVFTQKKKKITILASVQRFPEGKEVFHGSGHIVFSFSCWMNGRIARDDLLTGAYSPEIRGVQRTPCQKTGTHVNFI